MSDSAISDSMGLINLTSLSILIALLVGLSLGIVIGYAIRFWGQHKKMLSHVSIQEQERAKIASLEAQNIELAEKSRVLQVEYNQVFADKVQYEAENKQLKMQLHEIKLEQSQLAENMQKQLTEQFKLISHELLHRQTQSIQSNNKQGIEQVLTPFAEQLKSLTRNFEETNRMTVQERSALSQELKTLTHLNQNLRAQAETLSQALSSRQNQQGAWGEGVLERLLDWAGLKKNIHFDIQKSLKGLDGQTLRPDVIVSLPEGRHIVIDSKVSLSAYMSMHKEQDKNEQKNHEKALLLSLKQHMKGLAKKNYQSLPDLNSLDYVMMFVPIEGVLATALELDPGLVEESLRLKILLISPMTLIIVLQTIDNLWRLAKQSLHSYELAKKTGELHDKFVTFTDDFLVLGKKLETVQETYQKSMNKLSTGRGNLVKKAQDLEALGAKVTKHLDQQLIEKSAISESME